MDEAHRAAYLRERYSDDELIAELDRRLEEQGFRPEAGGVQVIVDYLREGWAVVALPEELAERVSGSPATPQTVVMLAGELRRMISEKEAAGT